MWYHAGWCEWRHWFLWASGWGALSESGGMLPTALCGKGFAEPSLKTAISDNGKLICSTGSWGFLAALWWKIRTEQSQAIKVKMVRNSSQHIGRIGYCQLHKKACSLRAMQWQIPERWMKDEWPYAEFLEVCCWTPATAAAWWGRGSLLGVLILRTSCL